MVLQECPNQSGRCANMECKDPSAPSHQWALLNKGDRNGEKICRTCDRERKKNSPAGTGKRVREEEEGAEDACAGDTLVEIIEILQVRCVRSGLETAGRTRPPAARARRVCSPTDERG